MHVCCPQRPPAFSAAPRARRSPRARASLSDAVGDWLVAHPAPLWLVNNPLKAWLTTRSAGDYDAEAASAELQRLIKSADVVVFSATYCPFSARAKAELKSAGLAYTAVEHNMRPDGGALVAELGKLTGRTSIPSIFIRGRSVGGCNDGTPGLRPLIASGELQSWLAAEQAVARSESSRRSLLAALLVLSGSAAGAARAAPPLPSEVDSATSPFVQGLLKLSEEKREERRVERLRAYDKRNFGDYLSFQHGARGSAMTENDRQIEAWLAENQ